jgi:hypothetical protein
MGRLVDFGPEVELTGSGKSGAAGDDYVTRVAKFVPSEVLAAYVAMMGIVMAMDKTDALKAPLAWGTFGLCMIFTPLYLARFKAFSRRQKIFHIVLSCVAFALWSYALGGPFEIAGLYRANIGSLLLIAFTLVSGWLRP